MILTVTNFKGGSSKTTTAAFLAHALAEQGRRVLVIDADPQASITEWAELAEWDIPVRGMATPRLHVPGIGVDRELANCDDIVIDTPPSEKERGIAESATRAATHVVVPCAPTSHEYHVMPKVRQMLDDQAHLGQTATPPVTAALLTRTVASANSRADYREALTADGWWVLQAGIARREAFAQSLGGRIERALAGPYGDALLELQTAAKTETA